MYFRFKEKVEDFIVSEELQSPLSQHGDYFFLLIEKRGINTMDIINSLCEYFQLKREWLGISGLKDKQGITRQRLSIAKNKLKLCGGEKGLQDFLNTLCKVLMTGRNETPLHIGKNQGNHFEIRLRKRENLPLELKEALEMKLEKSKKFGFPNAFGIQRFGKGNKNFKKASKFFEEGLSGKDGYEVRFKLQAFGNMRFNEYVMQRRARQEWLIEGDLVVEGRNAFGSRVASYENGKLHHFDYWAEKASKVGLSSREASNYQWSSDQNPDIRQPTGMVLGSEQLLCKSGTLARNYDEVILQASNFQPQGSKISKQYKIYGFRRPLRARPKHLEREREEGDLIVKFFLPTGVYASVFLASILADIDPKGCVSNGLIIPRIGEK